MGLYLGGLIERIFVSEIWGLILRRAHFWGPIIRILWCTINACVHVFSMLHISGFSCFYREDQLFGRVVIAYVSSQDELLRSAIIIFILFKQNISLEFEIT